MPNLSEVLSISASMLPSVWLLVFIILVLSSFSIVVMIGLKQKRALKLLKRQIVTLQKKERDYTDLFENVSDIVFIHSLSGRILRINDAITRSLGYNKESFIGKSLKDFMEKKYHERIDAYLNEVIQKGDSRGLIHWMDKDGREHVFQYINSLVRRENEAIAVRGIARDVTEQKKIEENLRDSEERYRRLIKHSPLPIVVHSRWKWVYVNDSAKELVGAKDDSQIVGRYVLDFILPEQCEYVKRKLRQSLFREQKVFSLEATVCCLDDRRVQVEITGTPIEYQGRNAGQVVIRDITRQKKIQEKLARAQRLETAGRLAGQIAHDFNNLLAPLTAYPTLIRDKLSAKHEVFEFVNEIEAAAVKIAEINQQLLALGRRGHYTMELIDLNELIQDLNVLQALPKDIKVDFNFDSNLFLIRGGKGQLVRALTNMIANANEAMQGDGTLTIKTQNVYVDKPIDGYQRIERGEYVAVDIGDTGCGIDTNIMNKIFEPFFTTKQMDRMRGSGLGLSIVHGVIEDHKGFLDFKSHPGKGTTFSLYLPISRDALPTKNAKNSYPKGKGEKILFVDDDPTQRNVSMHLLKRLGYEVEAVASGEEAVELLKMQPKDLLILDMVMDGIDGTETYRQVLEFRSDQKAIILSGYAMSQRVREAQVLGAGAFVLKPISPRIFAKAIRRELDRRNKFEATSRQS